MKMQPYVASSVRNAAVLGVTTLVASSVWILGAAHADTPITPDVPTTFGAASSAPLAVPSYRTTTPNLPLTDQRLVDLEFRDTPVRTVLNIISKYAGVNIVVSDDVTGNVGELLLKGVSPEVAIQRVVQVKNLQYHRFEDGTYIVGKELHIADSQPAAVAPVIRVGGDDTSSDDLPLSAAPTTRASGIPSLFNATVAPGQKVGTQRRALNLRYVPPRIMAYWLDPRHQQKPFEYVLSDKSRLDVSANPRGSLIIPAQDLRILQGGLGLNNDNFVNPYGTTSNNNGQLGQFNTPYTETNSQFGNGGNNNNNNNNGAGRNGNNGGGGGGLDLPAGVNQLVVVDPQNLLLVQTDVGAEGDEGFKQLQYLVSLLDRPLQQVEIEAQFVRVSTSAIRSLGLNFSSSSGLFGLNYQPPSVGGSLTLSTVRRNFQATLTALVQDNQAKVVQSPRVTAINNLTASLISQTSLPILTNTQTIVGGNNTTVVGNQSTSYLNLNIGLTVTPTINNDGTVTVVLSPQIQTPAPGTFNDQGAPQVDTSEVQTVAIVNDGDTIALGGLRQKNNTNNVDRVPILGDIPLIGRFFRTKTRSVNDDDLIIFLTARVVHRSGGEDAPVLGADLNTAPQ